MNNLQEFILSRSALNYRELARLIDWNASSFHQWLNGTRPIPKEKEKLLSKVLVQYGYIKDVGRCPKCKSDDVFRYYGVLKCMECDWGSI